MPPSVHTAYSLDNASHKGITFTSSRFAAQGLHPAATNSMAAARLYFHANAAEIQN
jgi:hypothetical protein